jgi:hypothetical protein
VTDIRELLDGIEKRADNHHMAAGGARMHEVPGDPNFSVRNWADKPHRLVYDLAGDTRRLVAALRAVLDLHGLEVRRDARNEPDDPGDGYYGTDRICTHCGHWGDEWPCDTVRAITDALTGVTPGTDR